TDVAIDLATGVALRDCDIEIVDVAFEVTLEPSRFDPPFPPDRTPNRETGAMPRRVTLDEARRLVDFPLLVPTRLPEGTGAANCLVDPRTPAQWIGLSYTVDPGAR